MPPLSDPFLRRQVGVNPPGNASCVWTVPHIQARQPLSDPLSPSPSPSLRRQVGTRVRVTIQENDFALRASYFRCVGWPAWTPPLAHIQARQPPLLRASSLRSSPLSPDARLGKLRNRSLVKNASLGRLHHVDGYSSILPSQKVRLLCASVCVGEGEAQGKGCVV